MAATAGATIAGVPALVRYRVSPEAAAERGTVLYYHGFGGDKGRCEPYLTALVEAGFLGVSLDAVGHFLTPELNEESCRRLVTWFERWLPGG
jgi:alpha-beta hydrolase superfamily lysophospholipase